MKERLALLAVVQDLIQDVQKLTKAVPDLVTDEALEAKSKELIASVDITEAQRIAKELAKGVTVCPFCEEEVRQIRPHLKACKSLEKLDVEKAFEPVVEIVKEKEEAELDNDNIRPELITVPPMKLKCNMCKATLETDDESHFKAFWETGMFCEKCTDGRMVSDMSKQEIEKHKKYRVMKPKTQGNVTI